MIDPKAIEQLKEIGHRVKALAADLNGQIIFNCAKDHKEPKVTIMVADVTKEK